MKIEMELSLLAKLGSMIVHADEFLSSDGHHFDKAAMDSIIHDAEVKKFIKKMQKMALVPVKRKNK